MRLLQLQLQSNQSNQHVVHATSVLIDDTHPSNDKVSMLHFVQRNQLLHAQSEQRIDHFKSMMASATHPAYDKISNLHYVQRNQVLYAQNSIPLRLQVVSRQMKQ